MRVALQVPYAALPGGHFFRKGRRLSRAKI